MVASGDQHSVNETATFDLSLDCLPATELTVKAYVMKQEHPHVILGMDFLKADKVIMNPVDNQISINDMPVMGYHNSEPHSFY